MSLALAALVAILITTQIAQDAPLARAHDVGAPPVVPATAASTKAPAPRSPTQTPSSATGDPTADQIAEWLKVDAAPIQPLESRSVRIEGADFTLRQIHGEAGAVVTSRGYGGYATASVPLGDASELNLGVAAGHFRQPWGGQANPRSISVGLYLDGRDVQRWISRDKCNVPRWGVSLPDDPQVLADGSCVKRERPAPPLAPIGTAP